MNAKNINTFINSTVPVSELTRAGSKNIFDSLAHDGFKIVLKNNKSIAALVSINRFQELLDKEDDLHLIQLSLSRITENQKSISLEDFFKNNGITVDYIDNLPDIELE